MKIDTILVPIDLGRPDLGKQSAVEAISLAELHKAKLHFLAVMPGFGMPVVASFFDEDEADKAVKKFAKAFLQYLKDEGLGKYEHSIGVGKPWEEIVHTAQKVKADLILVHNHVRNRPGGGTMLGSCSQLVAERAPCSVLVIKA